MSDRMLTRAIRVVAVVLVLGIPLVAAFYWLDRHPDPGPSVQQRAITAAEAAVRANPNDLQARTDLGAAYVTAGRTQDGIEQYTLVLQADAANRGALLGRGKAYLAVPDLDHAKADFQAFVDGNGKKEMAGSDLLLQQAYYELGVIALDQGRASDALTLFASALNIDRSDADAMYGYGRALVLTGKPSDAITVLRRAIAFVPTGWCDPFYPLADAYGAVGNADGVAYAKGMQAFCAGKLADAKAQLQPLVGSQLDADALIGLAYIAAAQGDRSTAETLYRQVLAKDPGNVSASIGLQALGPSEVHASIPALAPAETP